MSKLPLILAAIIIPSCAVVLVISTMSLSSARSSLDETKLTVAYSCAFLAGQYDIMDAMPTAFPGTRKVPEYCEPFKTAAANNGFRK